MEPNKAEVELVGAFIQHPTATYYRAVGELGVSNLMGIPFVGGSAKVTQDVYVLRDGSFRIRYTGEMELLNYQLSEAELIIDNNGATIEGFLEVPGIGGNLAEAHLSGEISKDDLLLRGDNYIDLEVTRTDAEFSLDHTGLTASMDVDVAGSTVHVSGEVNADGSYRVEGVTDINLLGMDEAQRAVDAAAAHKSQMRSWVRREYSAYASAVPCCSHLFVPLAQIPGFQAS